MTWTQIIYILEMLKFSRQKIPNKYFWIKKWRNFWDVHEWMFLIFKMESSNLINYLVDMRWSWPLYYVRLDKCSSRSRVTWGRLPASNPKLLRVDSFKCMLPQHIERTTSWGLEDSLQSFQWCCRISPKSQLHHIMTIGQTLHQATQIMAIGHTWIMATQIMAIGHTWIMATHWMAIG